MSRYRLLHALRARCFRPRWTPVLVFIVLALSSMVLVGCDKYANHEPGLILDPAPANAVATADRGAASAAATAAFSDPAPGTPLHVEGRAGRSALYAFDKPAAWNGDLVVWVHGYAPPSSPVALPDIAPLRAFFLSQGFAVAATSFSENGYAVAEAVREVHQLNGLFTDRIARPRRTFLVGVSLGGIIGLQLAEKFPDRYAGALLASGVVGGSRAEVQYVADMRVLYDHFHPGVLPGDIVHVPADVAFQPTIVGAVTSRLGTAEGQAAFGKFLGFAGERGLVFADPNEAVLAFLQVLGFQWVGGGDLFDRTHRHMLYDNTETQYAAPGLPAPIVDELNANVERYASMPDAEAYLRHWYEPTGELRIPVITLHDTRDPVVPYFHEQLLQDRVSSAGALGLLRQYAKLSFGHVSPAVQGDIPARFVELVAWANALENPAP